MICYLYPEPSYFLFIPDLVLVYYSHVPVAILSLIIGIFVYIHGRKYLINKLLFLIVMSFFAWSFANLVTWTNIHSDIVLTAWAILGPLYSLISILSVYFMYVFLWGKDISLRLKLLLGALVAPVFILAPSSFHLSGFNIINCDAFGFEGPEYNWYVIALGVLSMVWILGLILWKYRISPPEQRQKIALMGFGIELFLFLFYATVFLAGYLTSSGFLPDSDIEMFGLLGMAVFMVYIGILMVRYNTFHSGLLAAQALVVALIVLIGAQLTFVRSTTNIVLTLIALTLTAIIGFILIRSVKTEIEQRKRIEALAQDLEKANKQQVTLIHFITHQIKGFVTKSRNIFSVIKEGDFGPVPESMRPLIEEGFNSDTKGVATIQGILNAANIKSGKVDYKKEPFDLKALIDEVTHDLTSNADKKGLVLVVETGNAPLTYTGDREQLVNAFKNLIDNSIKYTPQGEVRVSLSQEGKTVRFIVADTGVGITPDDMAHLFTEGGHGANSTKVNVESTGFGLYIVKNIIEAHGGKTWAESEGEGKGARFIVELPV